MTKFVKFYLLFIWAVLIFIGLTFPVRVYEVKIFTWYDKFVHFYLFGIFNIFLLIFLAEFARPSIKTKLVGATLISAGYSAFGEYLQSFIPSRTVSELDFLAGLSGAIVAAFVYFFWDKIFTVKKPKLLLHICCIGCGAYVSRELQQIYDVSLYFYNPNIYPQTEYDKRLEEIRKVAAMTDLKVLIESYDHAGWLAMVKGHEADPERGERCRMCYEYRLEKTAQKALSLGYPWFASTLTVSPHKNALWINEIGNNLSIKYGLNFLDRDFKKNDGFKKATQLSRELHLYRQDYCGCEFSLRK